MTDLVDPHIVLDRYAQRLRWSYSRSQHYRREDSVFFIICQQLNEGNLSPTVEGRRAILLRMMNLVKNPEGRYENRSDLWALLPLNEGVLVELEGLLHGDTQGLTHLKIEEEERKKDEVEIKIVGEKIEEDLESDGQKNEADDNQVEEKDEVKLEVSISEHEEEEEEEEEYEDDEEEEGWLSDDKEEEKIETLHKISLNLFTFFSLFDENVRRHLLNYEYVSPSCAVRKIIRPFRIGMNESVVDDNERWLLEEIVHFLHGDNMRKVQLGLQFLFALSKHFVVLSEPCQKRFVEILNDSSLHRFPRKDTSKNEYFEGRIGCILFDAGEVAQNQQLLPGIYRRNGDDSFRCCPDETCIEAAIVSCLTVTTDNNKIRDSLMLLQDALPNSAVSIQSILDVVKNNREHEAVITCYCDYVRQIREKTDETDQIFKSELLYVLFLAFAQTSEDHQALLLQDLQDPEILTFEAFGEVQSGPVSSVVFTEKNVSCWMVEPTGIPSVPTPPGPAAPRPRCILASGPKYSRLSCLGAGIRSCLDQPNSTKRNSSLLLLQQALPYSAISMEILEEVIMHCVKDNTVETESEVGRAGFVKYALDSWTNAKDIDDITIEWLFDAFAHSSKAVQAMLVKLLCEPVELFGGDELQYSGTLASFCWTEIDTYGQMGYDAPATVKSISCADVAIQSALQHSEDAKQEESLIALHPTLPFAKVSAANTCKVLKAYGNNDEVSAPFKEYALEKLGVEKGESKAQLMFGLCHSFARYGHDKQLTLVKALCDDESITVKQRNKEVDCRMGCIIFKRDDRVQNIASPGIHYVQGQSCFDAAITSCLSAADNRTKLASLSLLLPKLASASLSFRHLDTLCADSHYRTMIVEALQTAPSEVRESFFKTAGAAKKSSGIHTLLDEYQSAVKGRKRPREGGVGEVSAARPVRLEKQKAREAIFLFCSGQAQE
uniref:Uncharacterized protein n=1 Tax=Palpitomonas bilix TaxID=652834 RepID=A0A7S3D3Y3_9EUKA